MKWTVLGLAALAAVTSYVFWPKTAKASDWCNEHQRSEATCPWCNTAYVNDLGACPEHGWPEAFCFACHPDLEAGFRAENDWCGEHAVPESQCQLCGAQVPVQAADSLPLGAPQCPSSGKVVVLQSPEIAQHVGLELVPLQQNSEKQRIHIPAQTQFDQNHYAKVRVRTEGVLERLSVDLGDWVEAGEVLAQLDVRELSELKAQWQQSQAQLQLAQTRLEQDQLLASQGLLAERERLQTESAWKDAKAQNDAAFAALQNLGFDPQSEAALLSVKAPIRGQVVARNHVPGETLEENEILLEIADTSRLWLMLAIPQDQASLVQKGLWVDFPVGETSMLPQRGEVEWLSASLDPHTQTLQARVLLDNRLARLQANRFGQAAVFLEQGASWQVPKAAVQWEGCCQIVFVAESAQRFRPVKVNIQRELEDSYQVEADFMPEHRLVTTGSFLLKTELVKDNIGAGCCQADAGH